MRVLTPSSERLARVIDRVTQFDEAVDKWADSVRGPRLDPVFYGLSSAADHGLLWLAIGALRAPRAGDPAIALRLGVIMGTDSTLTNGPIKQCFRRVRPELEHLEEKLPYGMHRPITSSFPSGHAASAFTVATVLAGGPRHSPALRPGRDGGGKPGVRAHAPRLRHHRRGGLGRRHGRGGPEGAAAQRETASSQRQVASKATTDPGRRN